MKKGNLSITLKRSGIGSSKAQKKVLKGLGLRKLHKTVLRPDSSEIWGMVKKVGHLIQVQKEK